METPTIKTMHLTEEILTEIIVRLPLRIIARFKLVSKKWKSIIESVYFRRVVACLHQNSSWLLMTYFDGSVLVGFNGCETWDLQKSLSLFIPPKLRLIEASSHGLVMISEGYDSNDCFVGNPVLQKWIKIPPDPDNSYAFGLVTRVDDDGFVLGFKVVRYAAKQATDTDFKVFLYSSETGIWTSKIIHCGPYQITYPASITLNGTIYYSHVSEPGVLAAYDVYSESSDQFRVIPLPDQHNHDFKSALTTSGGSVMYIRTLAQSSSTVFKAWRLNSGDSSWQLLWNIDLPLLIREYVPMAMHLFDSDIVYLWNQENRHVVSCNLRTQKNRILEDAGNDDDDRQHYFLRQRICEYVMDKICKDNVSVGLLQVMLPRWMESLPCPPQAEMIDTTSLPCYFSSMQQHVWHEGEVYNNNFWQVGGF